MSGSAIQTKLLGESDLGVIWLFHISCWAFASVLILLLMTTPAGAVALDCQGVNCIIPVEQTPSANFDITGVSLTPGSVGIPTRDCGPFGAFTCYDGFTLPTPVKIEVSFSATYFGKFEHQGAPLTVTGSNILLKELDVLVDNDVERFQGGSRFIGDVFGGVKRTGVDIPLTGAIPFELSVSPGKLNEQCANGCNSFIGYVAEGGGLELGIDKSASYLDVAFLGNPKFFNRINLLGEKIVVGSPEPGTVLLLGSGLIGLIGWQRRKQQNRKATN